jgi:iron complex transport system permease protein
MTAARQRGSVRFGGVSILLAALLFVLLFLSLVVGSTDVALTPAPLADAVKVLFHKILGRPETDEALKTYSRLVVGLRLPRALTAAAVGASLAVSGCAMQGLLKNPLADGSILGISSGGSLGAVLFLLLGAGLPAALSGAGVALFSIAFSFLSLLVVLALAWRIDRGLATETIILLGVVFSMLAGSLTSLVITFSGNKMHGIVFWLMGSLTYSTYSDLLWLLPVSVAGAVFLFLRAQELNALALGEEQAGYIGVNTKAVKLQIMVAAAALVGSSVAVGGVIGFVGLISPHIMRLFTGSNHRRLIPASALFGASFLVLADLIGRTAARPSEIPIGVITSLAGSALFIYLFVSMRRRAARC